MEAQSACLLTPTEYSYALTCTEPSRYGIQHKPPEAPGKSSSEGVPIGLLSILRWKLLLLRFFANQMGNWELSLVAPSEPLPPNVRDRVFTAFKKATELESDNYKAWHLWAMVRHAYVSYLFLLGFFRLGDGETRVVLFLFFLLDLAFVFRSCCCSRCPCCFLIGPISGRNSPKMPTIVRVRRRSISTYPLHENRMEPIIACDRIIPRSLFPSALSPRISPR